MSGGVWRDVLPTHKTVLAVVGDGPAIPVRNRRLAGEVLGSDALACRVVRHAVSGNSIPRTVDECLAFPFNGFAAAIGCCDVACRLAGNGGRRLFVEVGDGFNPEIGGESVVVDVEFAVLVANGGDSAAAGG